MAWLCGRRAVASVEIPGCVVNASGQPCPVPTHSADEISRLKSQLEASESARAAAESACAAADAAHSALVDDITTILHDFAPARVGGLGWDVYRRLQRSLGLPMTTPPPPVSNRVSVDTAAPLLVLVEPLLSAASSSRSLAEELLYEAAAPPPVALPGPPPALGLRPVALSADDRMLDSEGRGSSPATSAYSIAARVDPPASPSAGPRGRLSLTPGTARRLAAARAPHAAGPPSAQFIEEAAAAAAAAHAAAASARAAVAAVAAAPLPTPNSALSSPVPALPRRRAGLFVSDAVASTDAPGAEVADSYAPALTGTDASPLPSRGTFASSLVASPAAASQRPEDALSVHFDQERPSDTKPAPPFARMHTTSRLDFPDATSPLDVPVPLTSPGAEPPPHDGMDERFASDLGPATPRAGGPHPMRKHASIDLDATPLPVPEGMRADTRGLEAESPSSTMSPLPPARFESTRSILSGSAPPEATASLGAPSNALSGDTLREATASLAAPSNALSGDTAPEATASLAAPSNDLLGDTLPEATASLAAPTSGFFSAASLTALLKSAGAMNQPTSLLSSGVDGDIHSPPIAPAEPLYRLPQLPPVSMLPEANRDMPTPPLAAVADVQESTSPHPQGTPPAAVARAAAEFPGVDWPVSPPSGSFTEALSSAEPLAEKDSPRPSPVVRGDALATQPSSPECTIEALDAAQSPPVMASASAPTSPDRSAADLASEIVAAAAIAAAAALSYSPLSPQRSPAVGTPGGAVACVIANGSPLEALPADAASPSHHVEPATPEMVLPDEYEEAAKVDAGQLELTPPIEGPVSPEGGLSSARFEHELSPPSAPARAGPLSPQPAPSVDLAVSVQAVAPQPELAPLSPPMRSPAHGSPHGIPSQASHVPAAAASVTPLSPRDSALRAVSLALDLSPGAVAQRQVIVQQYTQPLDDLAARVDRYVSRLDEPTTAAVVFPTLPQRAFIDPSVAEAPRSPRDTSPAGSLPAEDSHKRYMRFLPQPSNRAPEPRSVSDGATVGSSSRGVGAESFPLGPSAGTPSLASVAGVAGAPGPAPAASVEDTDTLPITSIAALLHHSFLAPANAGNAAELYLQRPHRLAPDCAALLPPPAAPSLPTARSVSPGAVLGNDAPGLAPRGAAPGASGASPGSGSASPPHSPRRAPAAASSAADRYLSHDRAATGETPPASVEGVAPSPPLAAGPLLAVAGAPEEMCAASPLPPPASVGEASAAVDATPAPPPPPLPSAGTGEARVLAAPVPPQGASVVLLASPSPPRPPPLPPPPLPPMQYGHPRPMPIPLSADSHPSALPVHLPLPLANASSASVSEAGRGGRSGAPAHSPLRLGDSAPEGASAARGPHTGPAASAEAPVAAAASPPPRHHQPLSFSSVAELSRSSLSAAALRSPSAHLSAQQGGQRSAAAAAAATSESSAAAAYLSGGAAQSSNAGMQRFGPGAVVASLGVRAATPA